MRAPQRAQFGSLRGKRVFVTGGGSGIGEAIVAAFAAQGAIVAFVDIARDASVALRARLAQAGLTAPQFRQCGITDIAALQAALAAELGDFDILVNNAASDQRHEVEEVSLEYWNERIAINQRPMFFSCQAVLAGMKKKGAGSIINFSSISWHAKGGGYPVYATTKAAVIGLTRSLARDVGKHGIRVNSVTPGCHDAAPNRLMGRRCGQVGNRQGAVLAADDSAMGTTQEFIVDAGWL